MHRKVGVRVIVISATQLAGLVGRERCFKVHEPRMHNDVCFVENYKVHIQAIIVEVILTHIVVYYNCFQ